MTRGPRLDRYDFAILRTLQRNGRITKIALAEAVGLSPSPCWERLKKLEKSRLITGYHASVDLRKIAPITEVLVELTLSGHRAEDFRRFESAVQARPAVQACWALGGGYDYLLQIVTRDIDAYQRLVDELLEARIGLARYFTYIVTKPVKGPAPPPLDLLADLHP